MKRDRSKPVTEDEAIYASETGDAETLARYLRSPGSLSRNVCIAIADALCAKVSEWRLEFRWGLKSRPPKSVRVAVRDAYIKDAVQQEYIKAAGQREKQAPKYKKTARGKVAKEMGISDRMVRKVDRS